MKGNDMSGYILDTICLLKKRAKQARQEELANPKDHFSIGITQAYYNVISILINQARSFEIPLHKLDLDDIDPEQDLLGLKKR